MPQLNLHRLEVIAVAGLPPAGLGKAELECNIGLICLDGLAKHHDVHVPFAGFGAVAACLVVADVMQPQLADTALREAQHVGFERLPAILVAEVADVQAHEVVEDDEVERGLAGQ